MTNLRKLCAAVVLTFALALTAYAGQTDTPPCPIPIPGQTDTPPCSAAPEDVGTPGVTLTFSGDLATPTAANDETSFREIAADLFLSFLPLF
jgi:hypothetical protein